MSVRSDAATMYHYWQAGGLFPGVLPSTSVPGVLPSTSVLLSSIGRCACSRRDTMGRPVFLPCLFITHTHWLLRWAPCNRRGRAVRTELAGSVLLLCLVPQPCCIRPLSFLLDQLDQCTINTICRAHIVHTAGAVGSCWMCLTFTEIHAWVLGALHASLSFWLDGWMLAGS